MLIQQTLMFTQQSSNFENYQSFNHQLNALLHNALNALSFLCLPDLSILKVSCEQMADLNNHTSDNSTSKCTKAVKNEDTKCLDFNEDEETLIARMFSLVGERWSLIAGRIPGRTAEQIEKYWTSKFCSSSSNE